MASQPAADFMGSEPPTRVELAPAMDVSCSHGESEEKRMAKSVYAFYIFCDPLTYTKKDGHPSNSLKLQQWRTSGR